MAKVTLSKIGEIFHVLIEGDSGATTEITMVDCQTTEKINSDQFQSIEVVGKERTIHQSEGK